jgi:hypothetical protein
MKTNIGHNQKSIQVGTNTDKRYMRVDWHCKGVLVTGRIETADAQPYIPSRDEAIARTMRKYRVALQNLAK